MDSQAVATAAAEEPVRIQNAQGEVDNTIVTVSRSAGDEVTWYSDGTTPALVVFASRDGSPFLDTHFHVPAGGSVSSGPARDDAPIKAYKYTVVGDSGVNDPVVVVDN